MRISRKADYAFRAMLDLALHGGARRAATSTQIAERADIPEKFLEAILVELRKAGLVASRRGPEGGHRLARPPSEITARDIWQATEGELSLLEKKEPGRSRKPAESCLQGLWAEVDEALGGVIDKVTLEDLRRRVEEQTAVPDFNI